MVAILHVQDRPDLELALALENIPNPGEWMRIHDGGVVQASVVHHQSVCARLLLGHREGWAEPRPTTRLDLPIGHQLVNEFDPGIPALASHLVRPLLHWDGIGLQDNFCLSQYAPFGRTPSGFATENSLGRDVTGLCY